MKVKEICDYSGSTLLGMNGGMVESPDSKRIIYARKADLTKSETEIWICDRDFENHRKVYDVHCGNHNGPSATFITNSLIVFRDVEFEGIAGKEPSICVFRILDVDTGEVKYKIRGKESHCAENGKITLVATEEDILNMVREHGLTPNEHTASVSHVQLNPSATAVMMRLGVKDCPVFGALGCIDLDTKKTHMIADKPVHQLWFDDDTYMATRQFNQGRHIEMETSYIARFSKDGEELEVLGGISNHMDGSFDRKYFAGDRCYPDFAPNVYLYKRGDKNPIATFKISQDEYTTWKLQVHPNPSFSRDGKRLYFNKQCKCYNGTYRTVAVFADISEII